MHNYCVLYNVLLIDLTEGYDPDVDDQAGDDTLFL